LPGGEEMGAGQICMGLRMLINKGGRSDNAVNG